MFKISPQEYYVASLDDDVTMSCEGMGQPKPKISWRRVCILNFFSSLKNEYKLFSKKKKKKKKMIILLNILTTQNKILSNLFKNVINIRIRKY